MEKSKNDSAKVELKVEETSKDTQEGSKTAQNSTKGEKSSNKSTEEKTENVGLISKDRVMQLIKERWLRLCARRDVTIPTNEAKALLNGLLIDVGNLD